MVYVAYSWKEMSLTAIQKRDQLNHMEGQAAEADAYMAALGHDVWSIAESDSRFYRTPAHPSGRSDTGAGCGIDAAKLDGYTLAQIVAMSVPAYCIGMYGGGQIPDGYAECTGAAGTPNYQGYLPKGAGSGVTPGTTGGSNSITPTANAFDSPDCTLTDNQIPKHRHGYTDVQNNTVANGTPDTAMAFNAGSNFNRTTSTAEPGGVTTRTAHKHTGSTFAWTGYKDSAGTSQAGELDIRPACRAVKFIMRLP